MRQVARASIVVAMLVCVQRGQAGAKISRFSGQIDLGVLENSGITEASGIAASRRNPNVFYTHNDSGGGTIIFAFNGKGKQLAAFTISGVSGRDWEDIAVGPGPVAGVSYIYIANTGDNAQIEPLKYIYRIPEPAVNENQAPVSATLSGAETITFQYPDGMRDCETLMVDTPTKDIYVVTKREATVGVYRAPYPQSTTATLTLTKVATLGFDWAVGGDISPDGSEIMVKQYSTMYYWKRAAGQTVGQAMSVLPRIMPYTPEVKSEAVCWRADGGGYLSVSEGVNPHIFFYLRLPQDIDFDGDGISDMPMISTNSLMWYTLDTNSFAETQLGFRGVIPCPGDYDGDGETDEAVFDPAADKCIFYIKQSKTATIRTQQFGYSGVRPAPGDYDGDGKTDLAVFSTHSATWHIQQSRDGYRIQQFGFPGVLRVQADYDGDAKTDIAVYDPLSGNWYIQQSKTGVIKIQQFGFSATMPVPGDYDADGKTDIAVYDPGPARWHLLRTTDGFITKQYGYGGVIPVTEDFDGDGRTDLTVYDPKMFKWSILQSTAGYRSKFFGYASAIPITPPR
jgi:hypothetical protein